MQFVWRRCSSIQSNSSLRVLPSFLNARQSLFPSTSPIFRALQSNCNSFRPFSHRVVVPQKMEPSSSESAAKAAQSEPSPASASSSKSPILFLFDMNETLIYRTEGSRIPDCDVEPLFKLNGRQIYARNHAVQLIDRIISHPRARFGVLTSMLHKNSFPVVESFLGSEKMPHLVKVFDQVYNKPDKPWGVDPWDMMRNMESVWQSPECTSLNIGPESTICIDNEIRKIREYPNNAIIVPSYTEESVRASEKDKDTVLEALCDYLIKLLDECEGNVAEYLVAQPFSRDVRGADYSQWDITGLLTAEKEKRYNKSLAKKQKEKAEKAAKAAAAAAAATSSSSSASVDGLDSAMGRMGLEENKGKPTQ